MSAKHPTWLEARAKFMASHRECNPGEGCLSCPYADCVAPSCMKCTEWEKGAIREALRTSDTESFGKIAVTCYIDNYNKSGSLIASICGRVGDVL